MLDSADSFRLPFTEIWFVAQGGDTANVNHHMRVRSQAYGLDFAKVGGLRGRALNSGTGKEKTDYFSWGEVVNAPTAGIIFATENSLPDNTIGVYDTEHPLGNYVAIKTENNLFVFLAHMRQKSVQVTVGESACVGMTLGECGNSGNSDFPHIHMHVQNTANLAGGDGKNITFTSINIELSGKKFEHVDWPLIRGLFVSNSSNDWLSK